MALARRAHELMAATGRRYTYKSLCRALQHPLGSSAGLAAAMRRLLGERLVESEAYGYVFVTLRLEDAPPPRVADLWRGWGGAPALGLADWRRV